MERGFQNDDSARPHHGQSRSQALAAARRIDHEVEPAADVSHLIGGHGLEAETARDPQLLVVPSDDGHGRAGRPEHLCDEQPEPAVPEDGRLHRIADTHLFEDAAGCGERLGEHGHFVGHAVRDGVQILYGKRQKLGEGAVPAADAGDRPALAVLADAVPTGAALPAPDVDLADNAPADPVRSVRRRLAHHADELVAGHAAEVRVPDKDFQICSADAGQPDADQAVVRVRRPEHIAQLEPAVAGYERTHLTPQDRTRARLRAYYLRERSSMCRARVLVLSAALLATPLASGCELAMAREQATAEWTKSYPLAAGGRLEIDNVNGRINVEAWDGATVDVRAERLGKGSTQDEAKRMLDRIEIAEQVSGGAIRIQTKVARASSWLGGGTEVRYFVKVPAGAEIDVETVNGGIEVTGLRGRVTAETTNGGVTARRIAGPINASTTNGGVDVDVDAVTEPGIDLECTNGGIRLRLPRDAKATLAASITNGGIDADNLNIELAGQTTRRRLEGRLNGGGPRIALDGTNGGIQIAAK
jgi:hypothetical protein